MDFLFSLLFSSPYVPWVVGALAFLVVYRKLAPHISVRVPGGGFAVEDLAGKFLGSRYADAKVDKAVDRYKKQGHYLAAGKLLEDSNRLAEAVDAYVEGQEFWAAASNLERLGKIERAAELYLQAGDHKKAAQMLEGAGKPAKAAVLFLEKGNRLEAARLFGLAGSWDKAADLYAKSGYPLRAAEAYEKAGDSVHAAQCYERHFMENVSYSTTYSSTAVPAADQKSALHAGRLFEKSGDRPRALQAFLKGGYHKEAAEVLMKEGQFAKAAELFIRAGEPARAADAWEKAGDRVQAANLRGELSLKEEKVADAARLFQEGKDYLRAAELFESVGLLAEAAGAYEAGDSFAAGSVYIRAGLPERAAAGYEKAGEFETAAKLYEQAGDRLKAIELFEKAGFTFKSGESAALAGQRDKAIALLQRVGADDEHHALATELLARLFMEAGKPGLAVERLQRALGNAPVSSANLSLQYWRAVALEHAGRPDEALDLFRKVMSEDMLFKDVEKRVARLEGDRSAPPLPIPALAVPAPPRPPPRPAPPASAPKAAAPPPPAPPPPSPAQPAPAPAGSPAAKPTRFALREALGVGPLGDVHRGEDRVDGRGVCLRVLAPALLTGDGVLHGLAGDLKAAAAVSHPNLAKVIGFVEIEGRRCVVCELVSGRNFAQALQGGKKMAVPQVHSLGRVLSQLLAFLHGKGLVHGSLKPSNIMVANGVVKVTDLGLARVARSLPTTPSYRAPEDRLDAEGDLYAMAAVLYHLLTGVHPRSQSQGVGLPLPSTLATGVPEALDKLLIRCLHPRRELRYASAEEVGRELKDMVRLA
jgi:eukaryotic-like serine/threonine-protein kinase